MPSAFTAKRSSSPPGSAWNAIRPPPVALAARSASCEEAQAATATAVRSALAAAHERVVHPLATARTALIAASTSRSVLAMLGPKRRYCVA